ncbi:MAG: hypothetical protein R3268_11960, partial [Acidiferrobacterales bacterium]|nr:hypothetical protein [Acidiferrobacterales bacterium]
MKRIISHILVLTLAVLVVVGCSPKEQRQSRTQGVYMLIDTSGTYADELDKALAVINYLLGTL